MAHLMQPGGAWIQDVTIHEKAHDPRGIVNVAARWQPSMPQLLPNFPDDQQRAAFLSTLRCSANQDILMHLAGPAAELRWRFRDVVATYVHGEELALILADPGRTPPGSDLERARVRLDWLRSQGFEADANFERAWHRTCDFVSEHWRTIVKLGRWLHDRRRVDGETLMEHWRSLHPEGAEAG